MREAGVLKILPMGNRKMFCKYSKNRWDLIYDAFWRLELVYLCLWDPI